MNAGIDTTSCEITILGHEREAGILQHVGISATYFKSFFISTITSFPTSDLKNE